MAARFQNMDTHGILTTWHSTMCREHIWLLKDLAVAEVGVEAPEEHAAAGQAI